MTDASPLTRVWQHIQDSCPITAHLLMAHGIDRHELAKSFVAASLASGNEPPAGEPSAAESMLLFLERMRGSLDVATVPGLDDAMALEEASYALLERLSRIPRSAWLAPSEPMILDADIQYQRTPGAVHVTLEHILTPLIMNPEQAGEVTLERGQQHILVYQTSQDEEVEYALLNQSAARVFAALARPLSLAQAVALLEADHDNAQTRARSALTRFLNLGVIRPVATDKQSDAARDAASQARPSMSWDDVASVRGAASTECFDALIDTLIASCGDVQGKRVLDVGMGNGNSTLALARRGAHAVGIDISERAVEEARIHTRDAAGDAQERLSFQVMDATRLDFADDSFDVVTCLKSLWCIPDTMAALREFHRVLREGGRLVVQLWGDREKCTMIATGAQVIWHFSPKSDHDSSDSERPSYTPAWLQDVLRQAGFSAPMLPLATHAQEFDVASVSHYWEIYRTLGDGPYYTYSTSSDAQKAAMDEHWRMQTSRLRKPSGAVPLGLEWHICTVVKT